MYLELVDLVDRFGAQAVLGRTLRREEMLKMVYADNIRNGYQERQRSGDWAEWAKSNPDMNDLINDAMKEINE